MVTLDLRDLAEELSDLQERADDPETVDPLDDDDRERMAELKRIGEQLGYADGDFSSYADNESTAILEDDFAEYAEELADDIGAINRDAQWPLNHIDWQAAADELKADYSSFDFDGGTYLVRSV